MVEISLLFNFTKKMKLFDKTVIKDSFDWELEIEGKSVEVNAYILGNGFIIAEVDNKDVLFTCKSFEELTIKDINEIYKSHGDDYWDDCQLLTVYELCCNQKLIFKMWLN